MQNASSHKLNAVSCHTTKCQRRKKNKACTSQIKVSINKCLLCCWYMFANIYMGMWEFDLLAVHFANVIYFCTLEYANGMHIFIVRVSVQCTHVNDTVCCTQSCVYTWCNDTLYIYLAPNAKQTKPKINK